MHWQQKALVMRICAGMPFGDGLYKAGQKLFGRLSAAPMSRLPAHAMMVRWLLEQGFSIENKTFFEVGTGHVPLVPIGFFLCGAEQIITLDLHRRIDHYLIRDSLRWLVLHRADVQRLYSSVVSDDRFSERFDVLTEWCNSPSQFLKKANIEYMAPADAAHTGLPSQSIDFHFSVTVLEHIPPDVLANIFAEAKRILKPTGTAVHFVDPSDHFQHQDQSITRINFLKFSDLEWNRIAGNEFAYCNRLRASDYVRLFQGLGFTIKKIETLTDQESLYSLQNGFPIDSQFHAYTNAELSVTTLRVILHLGET